MIYWKANRRRRRQRDKRLAYRAIRELRKSNEPIRKTYRWEAGSIYYHPMFSNEELEEAAKRIKASECSTVGDAHTVKPCDNRNSRALHLDETNLVGPK